MKNLLELRSGTVHADSGDGMDYTLCGLTAERCLENAGEYTDEVRAKESEIVPCMTYTDSKIDCETCARIIRYCCRLGLKSLKRGAEA